MRIGEFARLTGMPISVLRHYDKEGLLCPSHVDYFTGYRNYSVDQIEQVHKIELLKSSGLSLKEIRDILENADDVKFIKGILDRRESEYQNMLAAISEVRYMFGKEMEKTREIETVMEKNGFGEMILKGPILPLPLVHAEDFQAACRRLDLEIRKKNLQRISGFLTYGEENSKEIQVAAKVLELRDEVGELHEDISLPFEEDKQVVGKWKVLGEYAVKEDFYAQGVEARGRWVGTWRNNRPRCRRIKMPKMPSICGCCSRKSCGCRSNRKTLWDSCSRWWFQTRVTARLSGGRAV